MRIGIIGRTNVGKSTLFNVLTDKRQALVSELPGATRDLNESLCSWRGVDFILFDSAGLDISEDDKVDKLALEFTKKEIKNTDFLLFVVDYKDGILPQDQELARQILKLKIPVMLVVNKVDKPRDRQNFDFYSFARLALGEAYPVSAASGFGTGDLLDKIVLKIKKDNPFSEKKVENTIKIVIIGKPNTGKSTLLNALLGEKKVIVSDIPHTTREPRTFSKKWQSEIFDFTDTAGIRRYARRDRVGFEKQSVKMAVSSLFRSHVVLFCIDASEPLSSQDKRLAKEIGESSSGVIICANKWDKVSNKETGSGKKYEIYIRSKFPQLNFAPLLFLSAKNNKNIEKISPLICEILEERKKKLTEEDLEDFRRHILRKQKPVGRGTGRPKIKEIIQKKVGYPHFEIILKRGENLHFSYIRFIANELHEKFGFLGSPIKLELKNK